MTMKKIIALKVNGETCEIAVEPDATLLSVLREQMDLIGPKRGCDSGGCGCCTVHLDGQAVYSCMTYVMAVGNREVTTVEGIGSPGQLDPLQAAFVQAGAVQCGYCTCGMIMAAKQYLNDGGGADEDAIRHALAGNLCRCTGYTKIIDAVKSVASRR
jgi:carbon-monoxide dehydrogenase small subunit